MNSKILTILELLLCCAFPLSSGMCGGHTAILGTVPYHVQVRFIGKYACGGAIVIAPDHHHVIVTSGKCVTEDFNDNLRPVAYMNVYAGRTRINGSHIYEQIQPVVHTVRHPEWKRKPLLQNDIAVIHLETGFKFNAIVQPVNVTNRYQTNPTGEIIISGWGEAHPKAKTLETYLRVGAIQSVANIPCNSEYKYTSWGKHVPTKIFCAGKVGNPTFQGPCDGDNGSPATNLYRDQLFLVGVYTYRYPQCGNRYVPSLFTDLSYHLPFLREAMKRPIGLRNARSLGPGFVWEEMPPELLETPAPPGPAQFKGSQDASEEKVAGRSYGEREIDSSEY